jgi:hypothetical protein
LPPTTTAKTLGEIYAYGFRNAHRLSWDATDGTMFAADIGMNNIEEVNIVHEGRNYGWMKREGLFENGITRPGGRLDQLFPLSAEVLHGPDEGRVQLSGRDVRPHARAGGDRRIRVSRPHSRAPRQVRLRRHRPRPLVRGRSRRHQEGGRRIPETVAPVEEIQLYVNGAHGGRTYVTFRELVESVNGTTATRADLQLSRTRDGELLLTSRQDGMIRMLVPD